MYFIQKYFGRFPKTVSQLLGLPGAKNFCSLFVCYYFATDLTCITTRQQHYRRRDGQTNRHTISDGNTALCSTGRCIEQKISYKIRLDLNNTLWIRQINYLSQWN